MTLVDIVRTIAERLIREHEMNGKQAVVRYDEITREINEDVLECMRDLVRRGEFKGGVNINKIPMLIKKQ